MLLIRYTITTLSLYTTGTCFPMLIILCFTLQLEVPLTNMRKVINSRNAISSDQCVTYGGDPTDIALIEMSAEGALGVYQPDPLQVSSTMYT